MHIFKAPSVCQIHNVRQHVPPPPPPPDCSLLFHINRISRWDGAGANHISPPVSTSPKPHPSPFMTPAPLIPLPFDVPFCLYEINKIYGTKTPAPPPSLISAGAATRSRILSLWFPGVTKTVNCYWWVLRPAPLLCSCMPSVAPYAKRAAKRADRRAQWLPICRCRSRPLMHIKPTPPARRTSHPAFLVPGILINRADRKLLSGPRGAERGVPAPLSSFTPRLGWRCMLMLRFCSISEEEDGGWQGGKGNVASRQKRGETTCIGIPNASDAVCFSSAHMLHLLCCCE